jgi:hypothetical protein
MPEDLSSSPTAWKRTVPRITLDAIRRTYAKLAKQSSYRGSRRDSRLRAQSPASGSPDRRQGGSGPHLDQGRHLTPRCRPGGA